MFAEFGSISTGTMRYDDLLPTFADELERLNKLAKTGIAGGNTNAIEDARKVTDFDSEETQWTMDELFDYLNDYAPPYAYFGAHPGDGSDYGFWLSEDVQQEVTDNGGTIGDETPDNNTESGECLVISDHGNMTLYGWQPNANRITGSHWQEVWAIV